MGFSEDCVEFFGTKDLYVLFKINKNAKAAAVKKAYYQQSILWHPDRFASSTNEDEKILATRKFQIIGKVYSILSDAEKRKIYDSTGSTDDDEAFGDVNWAELWRKMFKKVTKENIDEYIRKFRGSDKEMEDVKNAYIKHKGDMDKIMETVIGADVESEDRIREIIRYYIDAGEVKSFAKFVNEPPSKRAKRIARSQREAKEAEHALKEIQQNEEEKDDLVAAIKKRGQKHMEMINELEKKYVKAPKSKVAKKEKAAFSPYKLRSSNL